MIRSAILAIALCIAGASTAMAAEIPLSKLSGYLNSFQNAAGKFTQINSDGTISTGTVYIKRPGRVRFEYDPPNKDLVIAGGGQVAIFDAKSNAGPTQYPLRQTPLSLILDSHIDLGRARMVVNHGEDGETTFVTAQDPSHPEYGNIRLIFSGNPVELRQWVVTDSSGQQTTVVLGNLKTGVKLQPSLFNIIAETNQRQGN